MQDEDTARAIDVPPPRPLRFRAARYRPGGNPSRLSPVWDVAKSMVRVVLIILGLVGVVGGVLYAVKMGMVVVGHSGMAPSVMPGDRVILWKTQSFELGDIALCPHPTAAGRFVMGRVVGRRGQTVEMGRGGQLEIEGETVDRDFSGTVRYTDPETGRTRPMSWGTESLLGVEYQFFIEEGREPRMLAAEVPNGRIFLMSDNRTHSGEDSRTFGPVEESTCTGRIWMRLTVSDVTPPELEHGLDFL
jgi:signal peptidase I